MEHFPFNPTPEQRANLERLALHLDLDVTNMEFDMSSYMNDRDGLYVSPVDWKCGAVGCAVGHAATLGIGEPKAFQFSWDDYAADAFGVAAGDETWCWMFSPRWALTYPTSRHAAARIRYALSHGIPTTWARIMDGRDPLPCPPPERVEAPVVAKEPA